MGALENFKNYFSESRLTAAILVTVLSNFVTDLVISFINDIVLPITDRDGDDNQEPDINKLKNITKKTNGITFRIGSFLISLIRFVVVMILLFSFVTLVK